VLVGLSVDYAIQFQARFDEARAEGAPPGRAVATAATQGGPVIGVACLATIAGFAVFALSPSPLVRSFGLLLVIGISLAFVLALTAGLAALGLSAWRQGPRRQGAGPLHRLRDSVSSRVRRTGTAAVAVAIARSGRILAAGLVLAVCGWIASIDTVVETDIRELAPKDLAELQDLRTLERETGISGDVNVVIRADDPTDPAVLTWAQQFQQRVLERHGFSGQSPTCEQAEICPAISLTDFFAGAPGQQIGDRARTLIESLPPFISQVVITRDPVTGGVGDTANMAFGIRAQSLADQQDLIEDVRAQVDPPNAAGPPDGTDVDVAGLPVIAAEANSDLDRSRWWLPPAGLVAVALVLLAVYRSARRALVPLVPVLLATGWSGLVVAAMDVSLNPMSATLGALVIAIATEFSVILSARYESERSQGQSVGEALRRTYERTGAAVLASGLTAIAGFAVLAIAGLPLLDNLGLISVAPVLSDFGLVTVADLAVALLGVMLVLPAALVWAEEGFPRPAWSRPEHRGGPREPAAGPVGPGAV
jgi:hydrophobe/amphiphile efflux-3 (HAE3) family protein